MSLAINNRRVSLVRVLRVFGLTVLIVFGIILLVY
jgi:hypothetical protein